MVSYLCSLRVLAYRVVAGRWTQQHLALVISVSLCICTLYYLLIMISGLVLVELLLCTLSSGITVLSKKHLPKNSTQGCISVISLEVYSISRISRYSLS
jgi:hypothetical protein